MERKRQAHYRAKRYEEALVAYEQAIGLDPDFADAYYGKVIALQNVGRHEEARYAFDEARRLGDG